MKNNIAGIASVETRAALQEHVVEKFVQQNLPPAFFKPSKTPGLGDFSHRYKDIECCAAELPVNGSVEIFLSAKNSNGIRRFSIPVTSRFIVFCAREENTDYKVAWSSSLS